MSDLASVMTASSELCFRRALTDMPTRVDCKAIGLGWGGGQISAQTIGGSPRVGTRDQLGRRMRLPRLLPHLGPRSLCEGQGGYPRMPLPISRNRKRQGQYPQGKHLC